VQSYFPWNCLYPKSVNDNQIIIVGHSFVTG
jgi:hypothetical protein